MCAFSRLAAGIHMGQRRRGDHHPQPQHIPCFNGAHPSWDPYRLQNLRDEELYRAIARANDRIAEAKTEYEHRRKRQRVLQESVRRLDVEINRQNREIMRLWDVRAAYLHEKKARERQEEDRRRGGRWREQLGREMGREQGRHAKSSPRRGW